MRDDQNGLREATDTLRSLLKAGLELGVAEAARRLATAAQQVQEKGGALESLLKTSAVQEFLRDARDDSSGLLQMIKEVWSRGGAKDRKTAAQALGHALNMVAPHKALQLARELATMSRNSKDAETVGTEAIAPILEENPSLYDRVKQFLRDKEPWVRRAAITGLVAYAVRKRRYAAMTLEVLLLLAEEREQEIKDAVRRAVKELSGTDWRATAQALVDWVKTDPARWKDAKRYVAAAAVDVRKDVEGFVFSRLARVADVRNGGARSKKTATKAKTARRPAAAKKTTKGSPRKPAARKSSAAKKKSAKTR